MKTCHVGSLPFLKINQALDYSFQFDVPTLFTLPRLDSHQYIAADLLTLLKLGKMEGGRVLLEQNYYESQAEITPFYFDEFFARFDISSHPEFKYQLIGPISFYQLAKKEKNIDFELFYDFLVGKYKKLLELLQTKGNFLFVLDEPLLAKHYTDSYMALESFVVELQKTHKNIAIHCCDKLSSEQLKKTTLPLNIDFNLYSENEVTGLIGEKIIPGISYTDESPAYIKDYFKTNHGYTYITPSCGLTYKDIDQTKIILEGLKSLNHPI